MRTKKYFALDPHPGPLPMGEGECGRGRPRSRRIQSAVKSPHSKLNRFQIPDLKNVTNENETKTFRISSLIVPSPTGRGLG